jgi:single-strand DNA-binding protein
MSGNYDQTIIVGNVGKEPEMRYTPSGTAVTSFSVAVNSTRGEAKITKWFRVSAWGKQAEVCHQYVTKGMSVLVAGELVADPATGAPRIWNNQAGDPQVSFEINASTVRFLSGGKGKQENEQPLDDGDPF